MELTPFLYAVYKLVKYALYPLTWVLLAMTLAMNAVAIAVRSRFRKRLQW